MKIELIPERASEILARSQGTSDSDKLVKGKELFEEPFANIFLCARKKSGKTTVLYNILKHCAGKNTKVICFASTVYKDAQWLRIYDVLKKNKIKCERYVSMYDDRTGKNVLSGLMNQLQDEAARNIAMQEAMDKQKEELQNRRKGKKSKKQKQNRYGNLTLMEESDTHNSSQMGQHTLHGHVDSWKNVLHSMAKRRKLNMPEMSQCVIMDDVANCGVMGFEEEEEGKDVGEFDYAFQSGSRMYKDRDLDIKQVMDEKRIQENDGYVVPEYIFVFDDLSNELRDPIIAHLLKTNRHYKSKVIISSQYVKDLPPSSRKQIDYWLLFAGHSEDKLMTIFYDADTRLTFEQFVRLYRKVTSVPYQFLLLSTVEDEYKAGFGDKKINALSIDKSELSDDDEVNEDLKDKGKNEMKNDILDEEF